MFILIHVPSQCQRIIIYLDVGIWKVFRLRVIYYLIMYLTIKMLLHKDIAKCIIERDRHQLLNKENS